LLAPPPPPFAPATGVIVHVAADDRRAGLWQADSQRVAMVREEQAVVYSLVCLAPCDAHVDARGRYRVMGTGLVPSRPFTLPESARDATVRASTGSRGVRDAGFVAGGIGVTAALFAGVMLLAEASARDTADALGAELPVQRDRMLDKANTYRTIGVVSLVVAGVGVLTSIALLAASHTSVVLTK
jgi:hypothetical protein